MYNSKAEQSYLDSLLARELDFQDLNEEIDDLVMNEIDSLEAQGVPVEDIDVREIELQVIEELRQKRIEMQLHDYGY